MNLAPASWIWFPSARTLPNTFVLFRRELLLQEVPLRVTGFVSADSRYRLTLNGRRVAWGPAPCDPRELDVDPLDLTPYLQPGRNVLGAEVLFYGIGEGTWVAGKPGFICRFDITYADGRVEQVLSDERWQCWLDRAHRPGQYKRWFLRALQEEFDARLHPAGWDTPAFVAEEGWLPAMRLNCPSDKPPICGQYDDYLGGDAVAAAQGRLRERTIPALREFELPALRLAESGRVRWLRDPLDWFEFRTPGAFEIEREPVVVERGPTSWELPATTNDERRTTNGEGTDCPSSQAVFATFEFPEQIVGWPYFTIDAPEGTIVELMVQESHHPARTAWLDTHMFSWSRFVCREGLNRFECFDFESLRWLQLHVRNATRPVVIREVGVRRRMFDWPHAPQIQCDEPALQRLFDAAINTLHNCAQETAVDGMGRERQQYSGDGGHQLQAIRYAFGETRLPARFLRTFSAGLTRDGYFLDSWPAYDRLARVMQRQIDASGWGPLLDHGVGFCFDCWQHYLETGDLDALREPYPRLLRFAEYIASLRGSDGLLPVENLGVPAVWIDHQAYRRQRHKQCAFNLYV
ncbi:MAG TPA: alpha-L-rhamnosidase N-terminal domain-containing protein, partial [Roseiflexaceae bacterium]|nr:alpha-L-rhamnosidase N-terminal domain-containing protein [Roseiflexaceae bacterium]